MANRSTAPAPLTSADTQTRTHHSVRPTPSLQAPSLTSAVTHPHKCRRSPAPSLTNGVAQRGDLCAVCGICAVRLLHHQRAASIITTTHHRLYTRDSDTRSPTDASYDRQSQQRLLRTLHKPTPPTQTHLESRSSMHRTNILPSHLHSPRHECCSPRSGTAAHLRGMQVVDEQLLCALRLR